ncbi:hypothetical protein BgiMline_002389, partial [Biomphalaria glabrata]
DLCKIEQVNNTLIDCADMLRLEGDLSGSCRPAPEVVVQQVPVRLVHAGLKSQETWRPAVTLYTSKSVSVAWSLAKSLNFNILPQPSVELSLKD